MAILCLMAACDSPKTQVKQQTSTHDEKAAPDPAQPGEVDPVCKMVKDSTWKDYHVYNADTVNFCSETCKTAFIGNPTKYLK